MGFINRALGHILEARRDLELAVTAGANSIIAQGYQDTLLELAKEIRDDAAEAAAGYPNEDLRTNALT
jgi:hypothetical protein